MKTKKNINWKAAIVKNNIFADITHIKSCCLDHLATDYTKGKSNITCQNGVWKAGFKLIGIVAYLDNMVECSILMDSYIQSNQSYQHN